MPEQKLRKMLWLTHYNHMEHLYGDDGEMQCPECRIDFKRDSIEDIKKALLRYAMTRHGFQVEEKNEQTTEKANTQTETG